MKKFYLIIVVIMSATFFVEGCDTSEVDAVRFYEKVHEPVEQCIEQEEVFHQQIDVFFDYSSGESQDTVMNVADELQKLRKHLEQLQLVVDQAGHDLDSLKVIEGGEALHRSSRNVVSAYKALCDTELPRLVKLMELPPEREDETWYKQMDELLYVLDNKVNEPMDLFEQEAYKFAHLNGIELYEN